jgi:hypothetical protein
MVEPLSRLVKAAIVIAAVMTAAIWSLALSPATSSAYTVSNYCNNITLVEYQYCQGAERTMYAVEGWGDQHSVCVFYAGSFAYVCSGGPGVHIYDPFGANRYAKPGIQDNAPGSNVVHGRAYQP